MLTANNVSELIGLWLIDGDVEDGHCHGLDVRVDKQGRRVTVDLLHWKAGRVGCETCSSDIARTELDGDVSAGTLVLRGGVARNDSRAAPEDVELALQAAVAERTPGVFRGPRGEFPVTLRQVETLPVFDIE